MMLSDGRSLGIGADGVGMRIWWSFMIGFATPEVEIGDARRKRCNVTRDRVSGPQSFGGLQIEVVFLYSIHVYMEKLNP